MVKVLSIRRRWWVATGAAIVIIVGGSTGAWAMSRSSSSTSSTQLAAAKVASVTETVSTSGTLEPARAADLTFAVDSRVSAVKVKVGDTVTRGQVLATVGVASVKATADAARATVASDQAAVSEAAGSTTELTAAKSALVAARAALVSAKESVADATLRATFAGTVTAVGLTKGEAVSASSAATSAASSSASSGGGASATTTASSTSTTDSGVSIQSTKSYVVDATVDDTAVTSVKKGQSVQVTPDGATTAVAGVVTSVSKVPSSSDGVVSYPIVVRVTGHPSGVYADASATLAIVTKHVSKVLEIPTLAITYSGSTASVMLKSGGLTAKRAVTVGSTYGAETQITSGLSAGDVVVVTTPTFGGPGGGTARTGTGTRTGATTGTSGTTGGTAGGFGGAAGNFGGGQ
jgi:macrolide-specific efflux system membrane fusion protein